MGDATLSAGVMNVYDMYHRNGDRALFRVRRQGWAPNFFARVLLIAGRSSGALPGVRPYHGNPVVVAEFVRDGEVLNRGALACPGTYRYAFLGELRGRDAGDAAEA